MDTAIVVAIIGGAVTLAGFVISGVFGLVANTSQRESAASAGVERALNERLEHKDELIAECRRELAEETERADRAEAERDEKVLENWELKGRVHSLEWETRLLRGGGGHNSEGIRGQE